MLYLPGFSSKNMAKNGTFFEHFRQFLQYKGTYTLTNTVTSHMPTVYMDNTFLQSAVEAFFPQINEGFDTEPFSRAFGALLVKQLV